VQGLGHVGRGVIAQAVGGPVAHAIVGVAREGAQQQLPSLGIAVGGHGAHCNLPHPPLPARERSRERGQIGLADGLEGWNGLVLELEAAVVLEGGHDALRRLGAMQHTEGLDRLDAHRGLRVLECLLEGGHLVRELQGGDGADRLAPHHHVRVV